MPSTSKTSTSPQEKCSGHKKKQSSKRSTSSSLIVNTSPTPSTMSSDAQDHTTDQGPNGGGDGSSHDTQDYLQGIGSQFDDHNGGGQ
ncbi:hypothetical protein PG997_006689 [Apiospora hydei]|uniref:Uncharacterized protein n=1 Tax=Apiospora hydei TaxID=1337664 RepID=A0ABR1WPT3_9PEZI